MGAHALLSPSAAHRWIRCPPSACLEREFPSSSSEAAAEGTAAHALCEHKLRKFLKLRSKRPHSDFEDDEMDRCSDAYVSFVQEQMGDIPSPMVLVEQWLDLTRYVPEAFGTADCIIVGGDMLHVIDFKYGMGVLVEAEHNPQMMLYALGALHLLDGIYDIQTISMSIFQPRRENVCTWSLTKEDLLRWARDDLVEKARLAYAGEGAFCAGEWCTFCRAAVRCRARSEEKLRLAREEFRLPPLITDEEIEEVLSEIPDLIKWANAILVYATDAAVNHGKAWKGFKVVEGRSVRKYKDEDAVAREAKAAGYTDIFDKKLIPLTQMEKLMGKEMFAKTLGGLIEKPLGKPALVPLSDKRPAIHTDNVRSEFKTIMEEN
ncbi:DUF2800 domain-containing protein [Selenomonas timonae]|uniref:DUF2800 domain-containing protein n=1 Tax=Selenomonas timonae TaxID=2754044 RepID=A0A7G7VI77_9FIRM|nr:DUF2800 domain-containing protein [Selenomonas timonae]QNH53820.1 DUF2800 domain-containing protein [Selenomonas timonae]